MPMTGPGPSPDGKCCNVTVVTRCKGCPHAEKDATMTEEYGPPIAVNGKRPEWLDINDWVQFKNDCNYSETRATKHIWFDNVVSIRLRADHPYYQSAEYKASVGDDESRFNSVKVNYSHGGLRVTGELRPDVAIPVFDPRPAMTEAGMIAALEATGHTVTRPDPLAADREFLARLFDALGSRWAEDYRSGYWSSESSAAMAYLRANKGRL